MIRKRKKRGRRVRNRSDSTQKCMWEHIIKKRGVFVRVCTLLSELIAMGILGLFWVKSPKRACQCLEYFPFAFASFIFFIHLFTKIYFFPLQFGQLICTHLTQDKLKNMLIPAVESRTMLRQFWGVWHDDWWHLKKYNSDMNLLSTFKSLWWMSCSCSIMNTCSL